MVQNGPFVLLDDACEDGAADALLFQHPLETFVAYRAQEVMPVLLQAQAAVSEQGGTLAGYLAYEAGLSFEPAWQKLAQERAGGAGPLVWFGRFANSERIAPADVPSWLAQRADPEAIGASVGPLQPEAAQAAHTAQVEQLQEAIAAGDIYQANLTFPMTGGYTGDPVAIYAALRPAARAGHGALVFDGDRWLLSLSPELFVEVTGDRIRSRPMKGTRARCADRVADQKIAAELAASEKDRAENLMIVDLMRNDLARIAKPGSVVVDEAFAVETYPTVHQMVTEVAAQLAPATTPVDVLRALFPSGSITGAPKYRAMELIAQTEPAARGAYCGAIGRIEASGEMALNVAIRTICLTPVENLRGKAVMGVGSAILADSNSAQEWQECLAKSAFSRVISHNGPPTSPDLIETMAFDPGQGIALLELHLERMKASAQFLHYPFDRHEVRNHIHALCFSLEDVSMIRLTAARSGATALAALPMPDAWPNPVQCIALPLPVAADDWRLQHKTSDRGFYEAGLAQAQACGATEALFHAPRPSPDGGDAHQPVHPPGGWQTGDAAAGSRPAARHPAAAPAR